MRSLVIFTLLLLLPAVGSATPAPVDYAYGMPLSLEENGAVYRFSMPKEVYATVVRNDLGDIRIFNSAEAAVPHVLRRPGRKNETSETAAALPFFPLYQEKNRLEAEGLSVRIERGGDGAIINVESEGIDGAKGKDQQLSGYIIDAGKHKERIDELDITWRTDRENFVATVSLEYSNDLTHWSTLVAKTSLVLMHFSGHEIIKKRIVLPIKTAPYLRLSWPANQDMVEVTGISAVQRSGEPKREPERLGLTGTPGEFDESQKGITAYEYDSAAQLPVDQVRLRFMEKNTLVKATLLSRPDPDAKWRVRKQNAIFFDLRFDQTSLVQDTVSVGMTSDRYWRVEIEEGASGALANIPIMELGWLPHELLFVARGEGPFMLAYGSARLGKEDLYSNTPGLLAQVLGSDEDTLLKEAKLMPKTVLGGADLLVPDPPPLPWRKWLLWGVLVVGVGVIARMALSLGKGMGEEKGP